MRFAFFWDPTFSLVSLFFQIVAVVGVSVLTECVRVRVCAFVYGGGGGGAARAPQHCRKKLRQSSLPDIALCSRQGRIETPEREH
jgi:hypothetical protein